MKYPIGIVTRDIARYRHFLNENELSPVEGYKFFTPITPGNIEKLRGLRLSGLIYLKDWDDYANSNEKYNEFMQLIERYVKKY